MPGPYEDVFEEFTASTLPDPGSYKNKVILRSDLNELQFSDGVSWAALGAGAGSDGSTTWEDVSAATYEFVAADLNGKTKNQTRAAGSTWTIPLSLGATKGQVINTHQDAAGGAISFAAAGGVTLNVRSGSASSGGYGTYQTIVCVGADSYELVGEVAGFGEPKAFTARALTAADDGDTLVTASTQAVTVNTGLPTGFGCMIKGACTFAGTATVTDLRKTGETVIWCSLVNTGTDTYDVLGGKA